MKRTPLLKALYRSTLSTVALRTGLEPAQVIGDDPRVFARLDELKARIASVRARTIYLLVTELDIPQAVMAEAAGISKQAVSKILRNIEEQYDEPAVRNELRELAGILTDEVLS